MKRKLHVVFVSTEVAPFAKSGELADVASALPKYLARLGLEVSIVMPHYRTPAIESLTKELVLSDLYVPLGDEWIRARVFRSEVGKCTIYFIDNLKLFWRESIYGTGKGEYLDNDRRFVFFNRAVLEFILKTKIPVDIIHCNSWHTALIPVFLKTHYGTKSEFQGVTTLLTLHNISYQGEFPPESLSLTGLNWDYLGPQKLSLNGKFNFLKSGILYADALNTVSPAYKKEILGPENSFGLSQILNSRADDFFSIRNGIDFGVWDPQRDPHIAANYSAAQLDPKRSCKLDLIEEFGLSLAPDIPLFGVVSYMTALKGFDILLESITKLMKLEAGLVVLGQGDERFEKRFLGISQKYQGRMTVKIGLTPALMHKLIAGADILLIPSRHEPCGLNQFYGFRYGTVPVVRATGGLEETVEPFDVQSGKGNGFLFKEYSSRALILAAKQALQSYRQPQIWKQIMAAGFRENYSWERSAKMYAKLYQNAIDKRKGG